MAKVKVSEWSATPGSNTDIDGINIAENCPPSGINDAIREMMSQIKDWQSGASGDSLTIGAAGSLTLSGGTANAVPYLNGSKVLTTGSALTFDGTNLGIGTSSPGEKLTVSGNIAFPWISSGTYAFGPQVASSNAYVLSGVTLEIKGADAFAGANAMAGGDVLIRGGVGQPNVSLGVFSGDITLRAGATTSASDVGAGVIKFETGGTSAERMRLDSSGNLGLGVTPSAWGGSYKALDINGGAVFAGSSSQPAVVANAYFDGTNWIYRTTNLASRSDQVNGTHRWFTAPSGTAGNAITFTQAMTLDASGQLGVGTTSPAAKLHIENGAITIVSGGVTSIFTHTASTAVYGTTSAHPVRFFTSNTERARIDSSGNFTTSTPTAANGYGTGAGGTVTQATSKATGVTLSKSTGKITMNAAALAASTTVSFTLTNTVITATDILVVQHVSGGTIGAYTVTAFPAAGSATIAVRNVTAGSLSEAIVLRFAIIRSVDA